MNKYLKKIFSLILIVAITIVMTGCAKVEYYRVVDSYGYIMEKLIIELDKKAINDFNNPNVTVPKIMGEIELDFIDFKQKVTAWKEQFKLLNETLYNEVQDITIDSVVSVLDGKATLTIGFKEEKLLYIFYGVATITNADGEEIEYTHLFEDYGPFLMDFDNVKEENDGFFTYKYDIRNSDTIKDALDKETGDPYLVGIVNDYEKMFSGVYDLSDVLLYQVFGYPDEKLHSNADIESIEGNINLFKWKIDISKDEILEIYKTGANRYLWYGLAMAVAIVSVVIIAINQRKHKEDVKKVSNENDIVDED